MLPDPVLMVISRFSYTPTETLGVLLCSTLQFECFTLERPWLFNTPGRSCIPEGVYPIKPGTHYGKGGPSRSIELSEVPGRTQIEIHKANTADELKGCIAVGRRLGFLRNQRAVLESAAALTHLLDLFTQPPTPYQLLICSDPFRYRFPTNYQLGAYETPNGTP